MPKEFLSVKDLTKLGFTEWKAKKVIQTANKRHKEAGGIIGDRSSAPRKVLEALLGCDLSDKEEA